MADVEDVINKSEKIKGIGILFWIIIAFIGLNFRGVPFARTTFLRDMRCEKNQTNEESTRPEHSFLGCSMQCGAGPMASAISLIYLHWKPASQR